VGDEIGGNWLALTRTERSRSSVASVTGEVETGGGREMEGCRNGKSYLNPKSDTQNRAKKNRAIVKL
jgi:hypothetical protein